VIVTAMLGCSTHDPYAPQGPRGAGDSYEFAWSNSAAEERPAGEVYPNIANILETEKPMLALYREDVTHRAVTEFFCELAGSKRIALPILYYADRHDLPLSLVFSVVWVESRFNPVALNRNHQSIDRGLFQLNSRSFPQLGLDDFFDPGVNARHGTGYLRFSLNQGRSWQQALAIYNAGLTRVRTDGVPESTQHYIRKVTRYRRQLEERFGAYIRDRFPLPST
jgi:soluble lytic murein transglycosylase-like protein